MWVAVEGHPEEHRGGGVSRFWAGSPAWPEPMGQYRWAARTKVRSSPVALTQVKIR